MSLRRAEVNHQHTHACPHCASRRVVIKEGKRYATAAACPHCAADCPRCNNTGYVFIENRYGSVDSALCPRCAPIREKILRFNDAHIPRRYASEELKDVQYQDNASMREVVTAFRTIQKTFMPGDKGIGLSGGVGNGKTMIMASFLRYMTLDRDIACSFVEFSHLLSDIRAGYNAGRSDADILAHLVDVPILVIDELGKSMTTEWQVGILDELVSRRYNGSVSTFFTTNFPFRTPQADGRSISHDDFKITSLEERVGARMFSRLKDMCTFHTIYAPDRRGR